MMAAQEISGLQEKVEHLNNLLYHEQLNITYPNRRVKPYGDYVRSCRGVSYQVNEDGTFDLQIASDPHVVWIPESTVITIPNCTDILVDEKVRDKNLTVYVVTIVTNAGNYSIYVSKKS